jgi:hypothetical protein
VEALRQGLKEEGFDESRNVAIEQRWAPSIMLRADEVIE